MVYLCVDGLLAIVRGWFTCAWMVHMCCDVYLCVDGLPVRGCSAYAWMVYLCADGLNVRGWFTSCKKKIIVLYIHASRMVYWGLFEKWIKIREKLKFKQDAASLVGML